MSNLDHCFTSYPDYQIIENTLQQMVPTCRPDYSSARLLRETQAFNRQLMEQMKEMQRRLTELEHFVKASQDDGK